VQRYGGRDRLQQARELLSAVDGAVTADQPVEHTRDECRYGRGLLGK
jgi:hypothetical protein